MFFARVGCKRLPDFFYPLKFAALAPHSFRVGRGRVDRLFHALTVLTFPPVVELLPVVNLLAIIPAEPGLKASGTLRRSPDTGHW